MNETSEMFQQSLPVSAQDWGAAGARLYHFGQQHHQMPLVTLLQ